MQLGIFCEQWESVFFEILQAQIPQGSGDLPFIKNIYLRS